MFKAPFDSQFTVVGGHGEEVGNNIIGQKGKTAKSGELAVFWAFQVGRVHPKPICERASPCSLLALRKGITKLDSNLQLSWSGIADFDAGRPHDARAVVRPGRGGAGICDDLATSAV